MEEDTSVASISRKEKQEAAKDAEERFGASSAWHGRDGHRVCDTFGFVIFFYNI